MISRTAFRLWARIVSFSPRLVADGIGVQRSCICGLGAVQALPGAPWQPVSNLEGPAYVAPLRHFAGAMRGEGQGTSVGPQPCDAVWLRCCSGAQGRGVGVGRTKPEAACEPRCAIRSRCSWPRASWQQGRWRWGWRRQRSDRRRRAPAPKDVLSPPPVHPSGWQEAHVGCTLRPSPSP